MHPFTQFVRSFTQPYVYEWREQVGDGDEFEGSARPVSGGVRGSEKRCERRRCERQKAVCELWGNAEIGGVREVWCADLPLDFGGQVSLQGAQCEVDIKRLRRHFSFAESSNVDMEAVHKCLCREHGVVEGSRGVYVSGRF